MRFAIIDGKRRYAQPDLSGECPVCGAATIPKCGEKVIWHWSHKVKQDCDHGGENETEWHREWKSRFPVEWQEFVQRATDGEKHVADVKTGQNCVIEFQHSRIEPDERRSREAFYEDMVWVVNGLRLKNDRKQFEEALRGGKQIIQEPFPLVEVQPIGCRLVEEWSACPVPVFFDFADEIQRHGLWFLVPMGLGNTAFLFLIGKENFIGWHRNGDFNLQPLIDGLKSLVEERGRAVKAHNASQRMPQRMRGRSHKRF
jgi:competence protein CoiA